MDKSDGRGGHLVAVRCDRSSHPACRAAGVAISFTLGLLWALAVPASAEPVRPIRFDHLWLEQGLSQSGVMDVLQDRQGYIWLATEDGLNRFDGYSFSVLRRDPADARSLSHNFVWAVQEDADGGLWVGTEGGLNRRAPGTTAFTRFRHDPRDPATVGSDFVWALLRDRSGVLWVGTKGGGLSRYDPARRTFTRYRHDAARADSLPHDDHMHIRVFCTAEDVSAGCEDTHPIYPRHRARLADAGVEPGVELADGGHDARGLRGVVARVGRVEVLPDLVLQGVG